MLVPKIVPMGCHCYDPPDWGVVKVQLALNRRCNGSCGTNIILRDNGRYEFIMSVAEWQTVCSEAEGRLHWQLGGRKVPKEDEDWHCKGKDGGNCGGWW
jgi:hypothetical protein